MIYRYPKINALLIPVQITAARIKQRFAKFLAAKLTFILLDH